MLDEIFWKSFGNFEFYINSYKNSYKRKLGVNIEKDEVHCYGCENDVLRHSVNIYIWKYTLHLELARCECNKKCK